jgi:hypothetical protein
LESFSSSESAVKLTSNNNLRTKPNLNVSGIECFESYGNNKIIHLKKYIYIYIYILIGITMRYSEAFFLFIFLFFWR